MSCTDFSTPVQTNIPEFKSVTAEVNENVVSLFAELEYEEGLVSECGFMFAKAGNTLKKYPATLIDNKYSLSFEYLEYDTGYMYRAYASNGKNIVYSDVAAARTQPRLVTPQPDNPSVPSTPNNPSVSDKYEIDMSHVYTYWQFPKVTEVSLQDWSWTQVSGPAYIYYYIGFKENTSMSSRSQVMKLTRDGKKYSVNLTQHAYLDTISFKCPVTKEICVELWDRNGDGEISYEEAALATEVQRESFAGKNLNSFNEFRHFSCAEGVSWKCPLDSLFEGSSLKSIVLPYTGVPLGKGMFRNCKDLEFVYTNFRHVEEETFMNCVSLKEVEASIVGERAYMGCTSLETVVQFRPCVPAMTFKGCTSLRTFEFDWYDLAFYDDRVIGDEAFYGCSSLTEMDVPREITSVGARAFHGCESLSKICFSSSIPPTLGEDAFANANPDLKIIVPSPLVNVYKLNWPDLAQNIMAGE